MGVDADLVAACLQIVEKVWVVKTQAGCGPEGEVETAPGGVSIEDRCDGLDVIDEPLGRRSIEIGQSRVTEGRPLVPGVDVDRIEQIDDGAAACWDGDDAGCRR